MSTEELLRDDARTAEIATLVELLDYRVERQGDDVLFRFVSGDDAMHARIGAARVRRIRRHRNGTGVEAAEERRDVVESRRHEEHHAIARIGVRTQS